MFVPGGIENRGPGIHFSDGTSDPATKTFTYTSEMEPMPGMKMPVREAIKIADNNHMTLEWYENNGGQEKKKMGNNNTPPGKKKHTTNSILASIPHPGAATIYLFNISNCQ